jgi:hypothetical protein
MSKEKALLTEQQLEAVNIDDFDIDNHMTDYPRLLAHWGRRYTDAVKEYLIEEHDFEQVEARLRLELKEEMRIENAEKKIKPPTDLDVKAAIIINTEYEEAHYNMIKAKAREKKLKHFLVSIEAKGDMLRSLGAKLRKQMDSDPSVRREQAFETNRKKDDDY